MPQLASLRCWDADHAGVGSWQYSEVQLSPSGAETIDRSTGQSYTGRMLPISRLHGYFEPDSYTHTDNTFRTPLILFDC
jgi:hypothetical protein